MIDSGIRVSARLCRTHSSDRCMVRLVLILVFCMTVYDCVSMLRGCQIVVTLAAAEAGFGNNYKSKSAMP